MQLQPYQGHPAVSGGENEEQAVLDSWGPGLALPRCQRAGPPEHPLCQGAAVLGTQAVCK